MLPSEVSFDAALVSRINTVIVCLCVWSFVYVFVYILLWGLVCGFEPNVLCDWCCCEDVVTELCIGWGSCKGQIYWYLRGFHFFFFFHWYFFYQASSLWGGILIPDLLASHIISTACFMGELSERLVTVGVKMCTWAEWDSRQWFIADFMPWGWQATASCDPTLPPSGAPGNRR